MRRDAFKTSRKKIENRIESRVKRANEIIKNMGTLRHEPLKLISFLTELERNFKLIAVDDDVKQILLTQRLSDRTRLLIARLPNSDFDTYDKLKSLSCVSFRLHP